MFKIKAIKNPICIVDNTSSKIVRSGTLGNPAIDNSFRKVDIRLNFLFARIGFRICLKLKQ